MPRPDHAIPDFRFIGAILKIATGGYLIGCSSSAIDHRHRLRSPAIVFTSCIYLYVFICMYLCPLTDTKIDTPSREVKYPYEWASRHNNDVAGCVAIARFPTR